MSPRELQHIANIIQSEVGYFNGWEVSDEAEREACELAAKRIARYLRRKKKTDAGESK